MTFETRHELLRLIEAVCEQTATPEQCAELERLVLADRDCCRLYVRAMEMHGLLHWDAGGVGSLHEMPVHRESRPPRFLQSTWGRRIAAVALVLLCGVTFAWFRPQQVELAHHDQPAPVAAPHDEGAKVPAEIPQITLPPRQPTTESVAVSPPAVVEVETVEEPSIQLRNAGQVVAFINSEMHKSWDEAGIEPAPRASDSDWVRRVYLDLAGRIPTRDEARAFLQDSREDKRQRLLQRMLGSADVSRHLATHWTNLLVGRADAPLSDRSALLSWMTDQFAQDRPWKNVIAELVTARGTQESGPANFLLAHLNNQAVPATAVTARLFLGEQLQCVQCHQHPLAKSWGQERFWKFNAFFQQTAIRQRTLTDDQGKKRRSAELVDSDKFGPTFYETLHGVMQVAYPEFSGTEVLKSPDRPLRDQLAELLTADDDHQLARAYVNRTWSHLFGRGFTLPVDDMGPHNPPTHPELLDGLTKAFVESGYSTRQLLLAMCLSEPYQLSSSGAQNSIDRPELGEHPYFSRMAIKPLSAEQLFDSLMIASGVSPRSLRTRQSERDTWTRQFFAAIETEENSETTTLDGTLPQVLMMMNGDLVQRATDPEKGRVLHEVLNKSGLSEGDKITELSLAALTRYPESDEVNRIRTLLRRQVKQRTDRNIPAPTAVQEAFRDVYWAYLNSSEFALNR